MRPIIYLLRSYPRSSQTFVLNEILSLEKRGVEVSIVSMSRASDSVHQPVADQIAAPVTYLREPKDRRSQLSSLLQAARRDPARLFSTVSAVARAKAIDEGYTAAGRFACLLFAVQLSNMLADKNLLADKASAVHIHAHFAHDPAYVAMLTRRLTGVTYSFTGHARDLYQIDSDLLAERVDEAEFVATVTDHNRQFMAAAAPRSTTPVHVVPQGTNTTIFRPLDQPPSAAVPSFLAIGRLVPKKGFDVLIEACKVLVDAGVKFHCTIIGEGPEASNLHDAISASDIADHVSILPPVVQQALAEEYRKCDVFVLPAVVTADGDSDALPTVLLEAMSCGRPVITTPVGGIAELVTDQQNGRLVEPRDVTALAGAMASMVDDQTQRLAMGQAARTTIVDHFDHSASVATLASLFESVQSTR